MSQAYEAEQPDAQANTASLYKSAPLPTPSDLAEHVHKLNLAEETEAGPDPEQSSLDTIHIHAPLQGSLEVSHAFEEARCGIDSVRNTLFQLEEKRHALPNSAPKVDREELELGVTQMDDQLEAVSRVMRALEASIDIRQPFQHAAERVQDSTDSSSDEDDADFSLPGLTIDSPTTATSGSSRTGNLQRLHHLNEDWIAIQDDVAGFKKELVDDRYITHFNSASSQAEGLMDSLEKALAVCSAFVKDFNNSSVHLSLDRISADDDDDGDAAEARQQKLQELTAVAKAFITKKNYYTPACEQTFSAFERSLRERATNHGSLLRKLSELKSRWSSVRERSSKMKRELKRIEDKIRGPTSPNVSHSPETRTSQTLATPTKSSASLSPVARREDLPAIPAKNKTRSISGRTISASSKVSASTKSPASATTSPATSMVSPLVPPKPIKSTRRIPSGGSPASRVSALSSSLSSPSLNVAHLQSPNASSHRHNRSISANLSPESLSVLPKVRMHSTLGNVYGATSSASPSRGSPLSRPQSVADGVIPSPSRRGVQNLTTHPPSSFRFRADNESKIGRSQRGIRAGSEPPESREISQPMRPASALGASTAKTRSSYSQSNYRSAHLSRQGHEDPDESVEMMAPTSRPGSAASSYLPAHYRPPSSATTHVDPDSKAARRQSRIPTFAFPSSSASNASGDAYNGPHRPGSALSQVSYSRNFGGASRSTMQTPEPMIAARVQRLNVYSKPSTGAPSTSTAGVAAKRRPAGNTSGSSSRPPPTRTNPRSTAASVLRGPGAAGSSSRTTPLSASALAKVPHAGPALGAVRSDAGGAPASVSGSSIANYRTSRHGHSGLGLAPRPAASVGPASSIRDGAATPTFSESGFSVYSGFGGEGRSSLGTSTSLYRANPNDALDVEIATMVNALGIPLTRVDPHLPRGAKTETGPGKEVRCRYAFGGGSAMICKLLELHKPSLSASSGSGTQRKVLVKVPGKGFVDLELWLLSTLD